MAVFDDVLTGIVDAFNQEGDSHRERVGDAIITLLSPETETSFQAKWRESEKGVDRRLGLFDYPNIQGTVAQDLQASSNRYSITFRFDDYQNHDLFARDFFAIAAREKGEWTINHPVYGPLFLQLISLKESQSANRSGFTEVSTEWIESIDEDTLITSRELAGLVDGQCSLVQLNSIERFVEQCNQINETFRAAIENTVRGIENVVDFILSPLFASNDVISSSMTTVKFLIQGSLDAALLPLAELAGQVQNTGNIPLLAATDTKTRITKYAALRTGLTKLLPGGEDSITPTWATDIEKKNNIITAELASTSSIVAFSQILLTADDINTRAKALDLSQQLVDAFAALLAAYEAQQEAQETAKLEEQYFSVGSNYNDLVTLVALSLKYMLSIIGDLKVEKKITLKAPISTGKLCLQEYGTIDKYDDLIDQNKLKSSEILWLPAGKEIILQV